MAGLGEVWQGFSSTNGVTMKQMKAAALVLDFDLYPRNNVDPANIQRIINAMVSGIELPPVIIDRKSKRVVDGFHRVRGALRLYGDDAEVTVIEKNYASDADLFLDAARYNAVHGQPMDNCDRTHCLIVAERLGIGLDAIAGALSMPEDKLGQLKDTRVARGTDGLSVPLKRTVMAFHGRKLTVRQQEANRKLSGMNQVFYANQLIELIESKMLDLDDESLIQRLAKLHELLGGVIAMA